MTLDQLLDVCTALAGGVSGDQGDAWRWAGSTI
jgi:hypothetical protein